jgi:hypothetical protein
MNPIGFISILLFVTSGGFFVTSLTLGRKHLKEKKTKLLYTISIVFYALYAAYFIIAILAKPTCKGLYYYTSGAPSSGMFNIFST